MMSISEAEGMESETGRAVLAQPTRARLFALLRESGEPLATADLAGLAGMHPNGIRNHLERLRQAGLVERGRSSYGRGRPRDEWTVTHSGILAERELAGRGDGEPGRLAEWLARAYPSGSSHRRRIEAVGEEAGLAIPVETGGDPKLAFLEVLDRLGFDPVAEDAEGGFDCRLERCPYRDAARENSEAVCALHLGMTRGLLESIDPGFQLREFEPHDPDQAGCLIGVAAERK